MTQRCFGRHNVSRKSINHSWFTDFIAWCDFTPRRTSYDKLYYRKIDWRPIKIKKGHFPFLLYHFVWND